MILSGRAGAVTPEALAYAEGRSLGAAAVLPAAAEAR